MLFFTNFWLVIILFTYIPRFNISSFLRNWNTLKDRIISMRYLPHTKVILIIFLVWWIGLWSIEVLFKKFYWSMYGCLIYELIFLPLFCVVISWFALWCYMLCYVALFWTYIRYLCHFAKCCTILSCYMLYLTFVFIYFSCCFVLRCMHQACTDMTSYTTS